MNKMYLIALIGFFASGVVHSYAFFQHDYLKYKEWREPTIINRASLSQVESGLIEQPVDHFDASINGTFNMVSLINNIYISESITQFIAI